MPDRDAFRGWGRVDRADLVRRRVFLAVLAAGGLVALLLVNYLDLWPADHAETLRAEQERSQWQRVEIGMTEADVRARLGKPTFVDTAPFDFAKTDTPHRASFRARTRLLYCTETGECTTVFLDANGIVLEIDPPGMHFNPVEL